MFRFKPFRSLRAGPLTKRSTGKRLTDSVMGRISESPEALQHSQGI